MAIVKAGKIDLVITDILMPVMDGIEFIKALKRLSPRTPIIAISGGGGSTPAAHSLKRAEMLGAEKILFKPFAPPELIDCVRGFLADGK